MRLELEFRNIEPKDNRAAAPGELLIWPRDPSDEVKLAAVALEKGPEAFLRGPGQVTKMVIRLEPTFDDLLAAMVLDGRLTQQGVAKLASDAANLRQGIRPKSNLPVEKTPYGIFTAIVHQARHGDRLDNPRIAKKFMEGWQRMAARLCQKLQESIDPFEQACFDDEAFQGERDFLEQDRSVYLRDKENGESFKMCFPGESEYVDALWLDSPETALFAYWARTDETANHGTGYRFLALSEGLGRWTFSIDPDGKRRIDDLAHGLQQLEREHADADPEDAWYDGKRHQHTIIGSPHQGSSLTDEEVMAEVRRWGKSPPKSDAEKTGYSLAPIDPGDSGPPKPSPRAVKETRRKFWMLLPECPPQKPKPELVTGGWKDHCLKQWTGPLRPSHHKPRFEAVSYSNGKWIFSTRSLKKNTSDRAPKPNRLEALRSALQEAEDQAAPVRPAAQWKADTGDDYFDRVSNWDQPSRLKSEEIASIMCAWCRCDRVHSSALLRLKFRKWVYSTRGKGVLTGILISVLAVLMVLGTRPKAVKENSIAKNPVGNLWALSKSEKFSRNIPATHDELVEEASGQVGDSKKHTFRINHEGSDLPWRIHFYLRFQGIPAGSEIKIAKLPNGEPISLKLKEESKGSVFCTSNPIGCALKPDDEFVVTYPGGALKNRDFEFAIFWQRFEDEEEWYLFVQTIGVSYNDAGRRLNFPTKDSTRLDQAFSEQDDVFFFPAKRHLPPLVDSDAKYAKIKDRLRKMRDSIRDFDQDVKDNKKPNKLALVYLAGHGVLDGKRFLFCPSDSDGSTNPDSNLTIWDLLAPFRDSEKPLNNCKVVVILDCCFSGAAVEEFQSSQAVTPADRRNIIVFAAAAATESALEPLDQDGVQSSYLAQALSEVMQGKMNFAEGEDPVKSEVKKLMDQDAAINLHATFTYAQSRVKQLAAAVNKSQSPTWWPQGDEQKKIPFCSSQPAVSNSQLGK
ncbi:MAG TPA: hypothetical protein VKS79_20890 [Gemmataceae bacterium]|nr:hypothetical protein [Gemmataceae bacterium]